MNTTIVGSPPRGFIIRGRGLTVTRALGLLAFAIPGAGFIAALFLVRGQPGFAFLEDVRAWPAELWIIAFGGSLATLAGLADFIWHVRGLREVSRKEERGEIVALALHTGSREGQRAEYRSNKSGAAKHRGGSHAAETEQHSSQTWPHRFQPGTAQLAPVGGHTDSPLARLAATSP